jgi:hypothetical protein
MDTTKKELENTKTTEPLHYGNSTRAQKDFISGRINNSVFLASCLVGALMEKEVLSYDDIENLYSGKSDEVEELEKPIFDLTHKIRQLEEIEIEEGKDFAKEIEKLEEELLAVGGEIMQGLKEELENAADEMQEIYEWWIITDSWVFNRLRDAGEPVIDSDELGLELWGRTCTGQAIVLDPTFWDIYQSGAQNIRE